MCQPASNRLSEPASQSVSLSRTLLGHNENMFDRSSIASLWGHVYSSTTFSCDDDDTDMRQPSTITLLPPVRLTHRLRDICLFMSFGHLLEGNEDYKRCLRGNKFVACIEV